MEPTTITPDPRHPAGSSAPERLAPIEQPAPSARPTPGRGGARAQAPVRRRKGPHVAHRARVMTGVVSTVALVGLTATMAAGAASSTATTIAASAVSTGSTTAGSTTAASATAASTGAASGATTPATAAATTSTTGARSTTTTTRVTTAVAGRPSSQASTSSSGS